MTRFYVYAYVRSKDSEVAKAGTPYYIGKGQKYRAYRKDRLGASIPPNPENIVMLETDLSEQEAFDLECWYISFYGRKDLGTGILMNMTDGGEGASGYKHTEESFVKMRAAKTGKKRCEFSTEHRRNMSASHIGEKNHVYGKPRSNETKKRISEAKKRSCRKNVNNAGFKLNTEQLKTFKEDMEFGLTSRELAKKYEISQSTSCRTMKLINTGTITI